AEPSAPTMIMMCSFAVSPGPSRSAGRRSPLAVVPAEDLDTDRHHPTLGARGPEATVPDETDLRPMAGTGIVCPDVTEPRRGPATPPPPRRGGRGRSRPRPA